MVQYMMILFIVFVVQFSVSCACLALNKEQQVCLLFVLNYVSTSIFVKLNAAFRSNQL